MKTSTTTLQILVVSDTPDSEGSVRQHLGFDDEATEISVVADDATLADRLESGTVDCVVCGAGIDRCLDVLSTVRQDGEGVPVVAFLGDAGEDTVTRALEAGATDVVRSTIEGTPPALVGRRIESAIDGSRPPMGDSAGGVDRDGTVRFQWYEGVVETSQDTAALYDADGRFEVANSRLAELYDTTPAQLRGQRSRLLAKLRNEHRDGDVDGNGDGDPFADLVAGRREEYRTELELDYPGQAERVTDVRLSRLTDDGEFAGVVAVGRDVTERRARERKIEDQRDELARLDRLNAVIRDVDQALVGATTREEIETAVCERLAVAGRYRFAITFRPESGTLVPTGWTEAAEQPMESGLPLEDVTAETSPALGALETGETQVVEDVGAQAETVPWREDMLAAGVESIAAIPLAYGDDTYGVVVVYAGQPHAFGEQELTVLDELGETVGHAIAAVRRREREETLTALYEATRDLLGTETEQAVSDVVVDVATEVLDLPAVGIFLFEQGDNALRPASATDELVAFFGGATTFGPGHGDSETWQAFATGETNVFDDISESERVANPDTEARSSFVRPLGEHGVFVAASTEVGVFDGSRRKLLGLLAATAETALDRVAGQAGIRERDQELAVRARRLDRLSRTATLLRDVAGIVVAATTREGIERQVCDRLAAEDGIGLAWIGTVPPDARTLRPRLWAGEAEAYLDEAPLGLDGDEPAARTAASGSVTTVRNVTDHLREADWARAASDRGYQSVVAVPLAHGEVTYGVVAVYADDPDALEGLAGVLADLGDLVAYGIHAAETRQGILAERVTELELRLPGADRFVNAVADLVGEPVRYREVTPASDGRAHLLFALEDAPVEEVLATESEFVGVEGLQHVGDGEDHRFRATVTGDTIATTLLSCGGLPAEIEAHPADTVAVVTLPPQVDVRVFVDRVRETHPGAELVSRRDRSDHGSGDFLESVEDELTERQYEVLATAYESGFFESPRETTGAELADLLGISQPTVTHHLREGQRRLFADLFGQDSR